MRNSNSLMRNALKLIASGVLGQGVALLLLMIVGRQYSEVMMGTLGSFLSWGGILSIMATGRYEQAIVVTHSKENARALCLLCTLIIVLFCAITFLFSGAIHTFFSQQVLGKYILLLPLFILFTAFYSLISSVALREKLFNRLSIAQSINGVGNNLLKVIWGSINPSVGGLISSSIISVFLSLFPHKATIQNAFQKPLPSSQAIKTIAFRYKAFPFYSLPQSLINTLLGSLLVVMLPWQFGLAEVGILTMAIMLARRPLTLISENIGKVYFQRLSETVHKQHSMRPIVRRLILLTFSIGIPLSIALGWIMKPLVCFFVGEKWIASAFVIQCMLPMSIPNFATSILNVLPDILGFQKSNMWIQLIMLLLSVAAILLGFLFFTFEEFIAFFYLCTMIFQIGYLLYLLHLVNLYERNMSQNRN